VPKLLPVCPFVETLPWDEEELLLFRSELEDRGDPGSPVAELPARPRRPTLRAEVQEHESKSRMKVSFLTIRLAQKEMLGRSGT